MRELGNVKKVARDSRHERSDLCVVVVGEGKLLQMSKEIASHIGLYLSAHYVSHRRHIIVCRRVDKAKHKIDSAANKDSPCRQRHHLCGCRIGYMADDKRQHKLTKSCQRRAEKVCNHYPFVFFIIGQKAFYKAYAGS